MTQDNMEEILEELKKSNKDTVYRRSIVNPLLWVGLSMYLVAFLLTLTILGIPIAIPLIRLAKPFIYKNYDKHNGL